MYYFIFGGILLSLIIITWSYYMNNKEAIVNGTRKMLKEPVPSKVTKNQFPLWQRFIYGMYRFIFFGALTIGPYITAIFVSIYNYKFFLPQDAIYGFDMSIIINSGKTIFYYFTFIFGVVPILFLFEFLFCRGFIKKIDESGPNMSFSTYSKQFNSFGLLICITIFAFSFGIIFNSYQYCTKDEVVVKRFYKIKEDRYSYDDIEKVVKELYRDENGTNPYHYVAWFKNGDKITIGDSDHDDISKLEKVFEERIIYIEIDDSRIN